MSPLHGPRVAVVSDTVDNTDGIAIGLRRLVAAARRAGHAMSLIGPAATRSVPFDDGVVRMPAAMSGALPIFRDYTWTVPELPALVAHLAAHADLVQLATPGPMGMAGLVAARMLGLPVIAQYHTEVAEYAGRVTGMPMVTSLVAPLVGWFYRQAELCLAPSAATAARLRALGVPASHVCRVPRGVDLALFDPARRDRAVMGWTDEPVVLYVGRWSREKSVDTLAAAWRIVHAQRPAARLVVIGDGPARSAFAAGDRVSVLGTLHGEALATAFASADVFAFPSETETFGNVVVEAAASGLPTVVVRAGAAHEHVVPGVTGEVVAPGDPSAFAAAIVGLLDNPSRLAAMTRAARAHAARYDLEHAVDATWDIYEQHLGVRTRAAS
jgi:glycosyltransferase involved in cell wall biosynthesis